MAGDRASNDSRSGRLRINIQRHGSYLTQVWGVPLHSIRDLGVYDGELFHSEPKLDSGKRIYLPLGSADD